MKKINHKQVFGAVLESIRRECDLNQKELVNKLNTTNPWLNMSYPSYSRFESGEANMSAIQFELFVNCLSPLSKMYVVSDEIFYRFRKLINLLKDEGIEIIYDNTTFPMSYKESKEILRPMLNSIGQSEHQKTLWAINYTYKK